MSISRQSFAGNGNDNLSKGPVVLKVTDQAGNITEWEGYTLTLIFHSKKQLFMSLEVRQKATRILEAKIESGVVLNFRYLGKKSSPFISNPKILTPGKHCSNLVIFER